MEYKVEIINCKNITTQEHEYSFINSTETNKSKHELMKIQINTQHNITTKRAKLISPSNNIPLSQRHDFIPKISTNKNDNDHNKNNPYSKTYERSYERSYDIQKKKQIK